MNRDLSRMFLHMTTHGADGRTPFFVADLHTLLVKQYDRVLLSSFVMEPFFLEFNIRGTVVQVTGCDETTWRVKGSSMMHINPFVTIQIPVCVSEICSPAAKNWWGTWPAATDSYHSYLKKHFGRDFVHETAPALYASETKVAETIAKIL